MKKILILSICLFFIGCQEKTNPNQTDKKTSPNSHEVTEQNHTQEKALHQKGEQENQQATSLNSTDTNSFSGAQKGQDNQKEENKETPSETDPEILRHQSVIQNEHYLNHIEDVSMGRIYKPEGKNAIEHLILARSDFPAPQTEIESAINDLKPYLVVGAEAAITSGDKQEAYRLLNILKIAESGAPSIKRLERMLSSLESGVPVNWDEVSKRDNDEQSED